MVKKGHFKDFWNHLNDSFQPAKYVTIHVNIKYIISKFFGTKFSESSSLYNMFIKMYENKSHSCELMCYVFVVSF